MNKHARKLVKESVRGMTASARKKIDGSSADSNSEAQAENAKLQVVMPVVKIRLEDLSYLKGLADQPKTGVKCRPSSYSSEHRLFLLGLLEEKEIPPCPEDLKRYHENVKSMKARVLQAVKTWDWEWFRQSSFHSLSQPPEPRKVTVVTDAGRELLRKGLTHVVVKKSCK